MMRRMVRNCGETMGEVKETARKGTEMQRDETERKENRGRGKGKKRKEKKRKEKEKK
jgi:hypothetical protein